MAKESGVKQVDKVAAPEPRREMTREEKRAKQEAEFKDILAKQRVAMVKPIMTREERKAQTEKFTAMISKQAPLPKAPELSVSEKEANKGKILAMLEKQREEAAKRGKM